MPDLARVLSRADAVIHLAGRAHVMHETVAAPLNEFRKVNVGGTETLASIAVQQGVKRFIYMSSIKVNGEATNGHPFRADDPPGYSDPYGQSKWEAEERLQQIAAGPPCNGSWSDHPWCTVPGYEETFLPFCDRCFIVCRCRSAVFTTAEAWSAFSILVTLSVCYWIIPQPPTVVFW